MTAEPRKSERSLEPSRSGSRSLRTGLPMKKTRLGLLTEPLLTVQEAGDAAGPGEQEALRRFPALSKGASLLDNILLAEAVWGCRVRSSRRTFVFSYASPH